MDSILSVVPLKLFKVFPFYCHIWFAHYGSKSTSVFVQSCFMAIFIVKTELGKLNFPLFWGFFFSNRVIAMLITTGTDQSLGLNSSRPPRSSAEV